jgi:myosin-crossreactive antigen
MRPLSGLKLDSPGLSHYLISLQISYYLKLKLSQINNDFDNEFIETKYWLLIKVMFLLAFHGIGNEKYMVFLLKNYHLLKL